MEKTTKLALLLTTVMMYIFAVLIISTFADPVGTTIANVSTVSGTSTPDSRADDGGTISTLLINVTQQNFAWKAYVGNITATLSLDDNNGYTIYDWSLVQGSLSGELYVTRFSSMSWEGLKCANQTIISTEQTAVNMGAGDGDNINKTFSHENHTAMVMAGTSITGSTCKTLHTYYNESAQADVDTSKYHEILIQNDEERLVYVTKLEADETSYVNDSFTYDFQLLVADDDTAATITTYYFYAEIDS